MSRRRGHGFTKIATLLLALLGALSTMGVSYSIWSDDADITKVVNTGSAIVTMNVSSCTPSGLILCGVAGTDLQLTIVGQAGADYDCSFSVTNSGTVPVNVKSITVSGLPAGAICDVTGIVVPTQIDPGVTNASGNVHIYNTGTGPAVLVTISFSIPMWSQ